MNTKEYLAESLRIRPTRNNVTGRHNDVIDVENAFSGKHRVGFGGVSMIPPDSHRVLLERNAPSAQQKVVKIVDKNNVTRDARLEPFSKFSSSSSNVHDSMGTVRKFGPSTSAPRSAVYAPPESPSSRSHSDSVVCDDIDMDGTPPVGLYTDPTSLGWDTNASFTEMEDNVDPCDENLGDQIYDIPASGIVSNSTANSSNGMSNDSMSYTNGSPILANITAGVRQITPPNPIEEVRRNIAALHDGDAVFNLQLDHVMDKLVYALTDLDSAYLFRDFAGHFTEFLDRFGPGGYDSHRAPAAANWILSLLLPLMHADADASDTHIRVYTEVSGWLQRMVMLLGYRNADVLFNEGAWERCVEHMSSLSPEISNVAFDTAETILRSVPLENTLVLKVILMEPYDLTLSDTELCRFRLFRVKLLSVLLERVDSGCSAGQGKQYEHLLSDIVRALEKLKADETDLRVFKSIETCLRYAHNTEALFGHKILDNLSPRTRRPHLSLTFSKWQQQQLVEKQEPKAQQKLGFFHRLFHRHAKDNGVNKTVSSTEHVRGLSDTHDAVSIQTSKSTRTLRHRWQRLFMSSTRSPGINDAEEDACTLITV